MKVIATVQAPGNDPVNMTWANDADGVEVLLAVAQLLKHNESDTWSPTLLEIRVEV